MKLRLFVVSLVIILVIAGSTTLALFLSGILPFQQTYQPSQNTGNETSTINAPTGESGTTTDVNETAQEQEEYGWKLHREKYFEFEYPDKGWVLEGKGDNFTISSNSQGDDVQVRFELNVMTDSLMLTLADSLQARYGVRLFDQDLWDLKEARPSVVEVRNITIQNGTRGYLVHELQDDGSSVYTYFFKIRGMETAISAHRKEDLSYPGFLHILNSYKTIFQKAIPEGWDTYASPYGFKISYPKGWYAADDTKNMREVTTYAYIISPQNPETDKLEPMIRIRLAGSDDWAHARGDSTEWNWYWAHTWLEYRDSGDLVDVFLVNYAYQVFKIEYNHNPAYGEDQDLGEKVLSTFYFDL
ncbi:MAG: hypothetical protein M1275_01660 [Patescibacteria group bacterium]|nr:hypothetical protein [Patescibacteria group bacterium]